MIREAGIPRILFLMVSLSGLLLWGNLKPGHNWGDDFAAYIMQAKSITEFAPRAFIEANRFTVEHSSSPFGPIAYPWGFPLLLAPLYALFGLNPQALKAVGVISYLGFLVVLWFSFRKVHAPVWLLLLVSFFALNPTLIAFANNILSDLPFLLVSTLCVALIRETVVLDRYQFSRFASYALIGAAVSAAFLIRTNGILLLATLGLSQLIASFQKRPICRYPSVSRGNFLINTLGVPLVPYIVFACTVTITYWVLPVGGMSYLSYLSNISAEVVKSNLGSYLVEPSGFLSGVPGYQLVYWVSMPLAIAGAMRRCRSDYTAIVYVVLTFLLYIIWPIQQGLRFFFPILPFYVSFTFSGLEAGCSGFFVKSLFWKTLCYGPVLLIMFCFGFTSSSNGIDTGVTYGPFSSSSQEMFSFINDETNSNSTIIFHKPRVMRLMTGRKSVMITKVNQLAIGDYLCFSRRKDTDDQFSDGEVENLVSLKVASGVFANDDFKVYRLDRAALALKTVQESLR
jgi:hypothetical protein